MKLPPGVHQLKSGRYRWRVMINGRTRTGTEDTPAGAALARAQAKLDEGAGRCSACGQALDVVAN